MEITMFSYIKEKISQQKSITTQEARWIYNNLNNSQISQLARIVRDNYHQPGQATYLLMSIINLTNICVAGCDYCSFYVFPHQKGGYFLNFAQICSRIEKLTSHGGTLVSFNSGFNPKIKIWDYAELFQKIHEKYPHLTFYELTVAEFVFTCKISKVSYEQGAQILNQAGVKWITGGGAEVLSESFRKRHSPGKYTVEEYYKAQSAILRSGINSTATMVIGFDETLDERLEHLEKLRKFQKEENNLIPSFLCWTYKPYNNKLGGKEIDSSEYQRWLGICRIYLDNFTNIRTSVLTQNENSFAALSYGANDFDLPLEDEVTQKAGATISHDFTYLLSQCKSQGYNPIKRDPWT
jgi:cyclic dehypoxanthinyl futalosine synthase